MLWSLGKPMREFERPKHIVASLTCELAPAVRTRSLVSGAGATTLRPSLVNHDNRPVIIPAKETD
jgi:hypothetical protein